MFSLKQNQRNRFCPEVEGGWMGSGEEVGGRERGVPNNVYTCK
jgi:hypothetical protein